MNEHPNILRRIVSIFFPCAIIVLIGITVWQSLRLENSKRSTNFTVEKELEAIDELATYSYTYSDYAIRENTRSLVGVEMPGTTNTIIVTYKGVIKVGFELSKATFDIDSDNKTLTIHLPEIKVLDNYIDTDSIQTIEFNNIFNPISTENFIDDLQDEKKRQLEQAEKDGLYELAEEHAKEIIATLYSTFEGYAVVFD